MALLHQRFIDWIENWSVGWKVKQFKHIAWKAQKKGNTAIKQAINLKVDDGKLEKETNLEG